MKFAPQFPPLLTGHKVERPRAPVSQARAMLAKGKLGAGDILWSEEQKVLKFALVLEPDVPRERCGEMLYLAMVAFGDAIGAISAPEIAVNYRWPSTLLINEASVGSTSLLVSSAETDGIPDWMILSMNIAIVPDAGERDPGRKADKTTLWDEGCGDISRTELMESLSRHIVNWIHTWNEEGFRPIHEQWTGRLSERMKMETAFQPAEFVSLDETGNALVKDSGKTRGLETLTALELLTQKAHSG